jgi:NTP pyrophosphatase (non-canonical NTP hydrolase)
MHQFVDSQGWYESGSKRPQLPRNLAVSLVIEAAEVLEHFQWDGALGNKPEFEDELADVTLYLLQLASVTEVNLEEAVLRKLDKNYDRRWDI